jgi:hypothetical protein
MKQFLKSQQKNLMLMLRVAILMFFTVLIGVNALYPEDYILLAIYVVGLGILIFFVPVGKIQKFLSYKGKK